MGPRLRQFADPTVICAVVVLLLNDRVLKGNGPAWLTGKLSDFAGVFLVAMIVGIVTARPDVAVATTGVGFFMIKVSYGAAQLAAPVLGGVTRQDRTDLIALLALVPSWLVLRRTPSPLVSGSFGALLATTCLVFAGLGVTATSCEEPNYVDAFTVDRTGDLVARIRVPDYRGREPGTLWASSPDGGLNWETSSDPGVVMSSSQQACDRMGQCLRVIESERVEQTDANGVWHTAYEYTSEQRHRMGAREGICGPRVDGGFRSVLVVDEQPAARVVVAMGSQGVLVRTPDGKWHRRAVLDLTPLSQQGPSWLANGGFAPMIAILLSPLVLAVAWRRSGKLRAFAIATSAAVAQFLLVSVVGMMVFVDVDYLFYGPFAVVASVIALTASFAVAFTLGRRPSVLTHPAPWASVPWPPPPPPPRTSPPPPPPPPPMTDR